MGGRGAAGGHHRRARPVPGWLGHPARAVPGQSGGRRCPLPVAGRGRGDAPLAGLPPRPGCPRALAGRRRHRPGRPRHAAAAAAGRRLRRHPARPDPGDRRPRPWRLGRGGDGRRHLPGRPAGALRRRLDRRPARPARRRAPPGRHPGAVQLPAPGRPWRLRRRPVPGLDLDGRPQLLRLPGLAGRRPQGRPGRRRPPGDRRQPRLRPRPGRQRPPGRVPRTRLPAAGAHDHTATCLYTLTPDRDFALGPIPDHDRVLVALGAAHGFKFAPCSAGSWPTWPCTAAPTSTSPPSLSTARPSPRPPPTPATWSEGQPR